MKTQHKPVPYVLLIDDDRDDLDVMSFELGKKGVKVISFDSSVKALLYLGLMPGSIYLPSLIVMDYNMPGNNGQEVLIHIKSIVGISHIPVVIYSTSISGKLRQQLSDSGALESYIKPWSRKGILEHVKIFQELALGVGVRRPETDVVYS